METRMQQQKSLLGAQIKPLRKCNATLTHENNQLHLQIIRQSEQMNQSERETSMRLNTYESIADDLRFKLELRERKIGDQERELERLRSRLRLLLGRGASAAGGDKDHQQQQQPAGWRTNSTAAQQPMVLPTVAAPQQPSVAIAALAAARREAALSAEDMDGERALSATLQAQVGELRQRNDALAEECSRLRHGLQKREKEVERVGQQLIEDETDGKDSHLRFGTRATDAQRINTDNAATIVQLTDQLDFVNAQVGEMEHRAAAAEGVEAKWATLRARFDEQRADLAAARSALREAQLQVAQQKPRAAAAATATGPTLLPAASASTASSKYGVEEEETVSAARLAAAENALAVAQDAAALAERRGHASEEAARSTERVVTALRREITLLHESHDATARRLGEREEQMRSSGSSSSSSRRVAELTSEVAELERVHAALAEQLRVAHEDAEDQESEMQELRDALNAATRRSDEIGAELGGAAAAAAAETDAAHSASSSKSSSRSAAAERSAVRALEKRVAALQSELERVRRTTSASAVAARAAVSSLSDSAAMAGLSPEFGGTAQELDVERLEVLLTQSSAENSRLRRAVSSLDAALDSLQRDLDGKDESIAALRARCERATSAAEDHMLSHDAAQQRLSVEANTVSSAKKEVSGSSVCVCVYMVA